MMSLAHRVGRQREGQRQERDEGHAGHPVSFKSVRRRADGIAGIVTGAVGDHARIFRVVLGQVENDLHQIAADVGNLGEDAAADAQGRSPERFADGEADEARPGEFGGDEGQDADHAREFHADEQQTDAHAGLQRNEERFQRAAAQRGERRAAVGDGIDADAVPRDTVAAQDSENRAGQNDEHLAERFSLQANEIINHAHRDQRPETGKKFSLLPQVGLAGFPDDVGDFAHRAVDGQRAGTDVFEQAEGRADGADEQAEIQNGQTRDRAVEKFHLFQSGQLNVRLSGPGREGRRPQEQGQNNAIKCFDIRP